MVEHEHSSSSNKPLMKYTQGFLCGDCVHHTVCLENAEQALVEHFPFSKAKTPVFLPVKFQLLQVFISKNVPHT